MAKPIAPESPYLRVTKNFNIVIYLGTGGKALLTCFVVLMIARVVLFR